jgi:hypothetical protein
MAVQLAAKIQDFPFARCAGNAPERHQRDKLVSAEKPDVYVRTSISAKAVFADERA